ncbi:YfiR family protein [Thiocystis violascens]|uniref:Transmembrane protein n=1 Tax=Thiocystis violascens (strain ATCC 17096 / DSM 198 / 6111) TaxID=765911 RepID=I3Y8L2_THIV6|nr:YfiR family protein [Thiocystis violascens]AFL73330.1 hypothetical protein Thivi_1316 [Thiocystis violascens DSM 198]
MRDRSYPCRRRTRRLIVALLACAALGARAEVRETELAAAYLYNFSKFVTWPSDSFAGANAPLLLCVYGRPASGDALDTLDGKSAQGHTVRVERRARGAPLRDCHVVYVSLSEQPYLNPLLSTLAGRPTLTVSEAPGFAAAGGMIGFVQLDNRLRFEINLASTEGAGLTISSQLLKLATRVIRD